MVWFFIISSLGTPNPQKRRRVEKTASTSSVVSVNQDQKSHVVKKSRTLEKIESPEALPRSSTSLVTPPRFPRHRPERTLVPPFLGVDGYVFGTPTGGPAVPRKAATKKRVTRRVDDDLDEVIEDSTEMDRLFNPLNQGSYPPLNIDNCLTFQNVSRP
jgi:hypothetical protein